MTPTLSGSVDPPPPPPPPPPPATVPPQAATRRVTPASSPAFARMGPPLALDSGGGTIQSERDAGLIIRGTRRLPPTCGDTQAPVEPFAVPSRAERRLTA